MRERSSRPYIKLAVVAGGYVAALAIAVVAVAFNVAETSGPAAQASSGMHAFGDLVLFVGTFGICSLVPTGLGLFFLRRHRLFGLIVGVLALGIVLTMAAAFIFILAITRS